MSEHIHLNGEFQWGPIKWTISFVNPNNSNEKIEFESVEELSSELFRLKYEFYTINKLCDKLIIAGDKLVEEGETMSDDVSFPEVWKNKVEEWKQVKNKRNL